MSHRCELCGLIYKHPQGLKRHKLEWHGQAAPAIPRHKCSVCGFSCSQKKEFFSHLETSHDVTVSTEKITFETPTAFYEWKQWFEKEDRNRFIVLCGNGNVGTMTKRPIYFGCHRSGSWKPEGKGLRNMKTKGSKKIDGYCPAQIKVTLGEDNRLQVLVTRPHWGHLGDELTHIPLSQDEKIAIAEKMASKVPFDDILEEILDDAKNHESLKRVHLITRKDLHNIGASLNLSSEPACIESNAASEDPLVTEVREIARENCVLGEGDVTEKLQEIRKRHKASLGLSFEKVIPNEAVWFVLSSSGQDMYTIKLEKEKCDCQLVCTSCSACIHKYRCSCLDSSNKFNMCKHIHLLCSSQREDMPQDSELRTLSENITDGQKNNEQKINHIDGPKRKIDLQHPSFSTGKKTKTVQKPSLEEKNDIKCDLNSEFMGESTDKKKT